MDWLKFLDSLSAKVTKEKGNNDYFYYPNINQLSLNPNLKLVFLKKREKTKILFEDNFGRKVYMTDIDIIRVLAEAPEAVFSLIIKWMKEYENGKFVNEAVLNIEGNNFKLPLIYPKEIDKSVLELICETNFLSKADIYISFHDLVLLISIIVEKEVVVLEENSDMRKSRQLKKFIILSNFYRSGIYRVTLESHSYNTSVSLEEVYYNSRIAKTTDLIFNNLEY